MVKDPPAHPGDAVLIPGLGRSLGEGNGNPLPYSCLGNLMVRGVWWAIVLGSQRVGYVLVTLNKQTKNKTLFISSSFSSSSSLTEPIKVIPQPELMGCDCTF